MKQNIYYIPRVWYYQIKLDILIEEETITDRIMLVAATTYQFPSFKIGSSQ
jgi:hypothetical protein